MIEPGVRHVALGRDARAPQANPVLEARTERRGGVLLRVLRIGLVVHVGVHADVGDGQEWSEPEAANAVLRGLRRVFEDVLREGRNGRRKQHAINHEQVERITCVLG